MAIKTITQLKAYFRKGLYPTESQFADMLDSYRHKGEKVDLSQVEGLADALNTKYNTTEAKIIEAKQKQQEADIDWLKTVQEAQAEDIDELQESDKAQHQELETLTGELAKVRELIKSGATLDQARDALIALGANYSSLYSLASTVKTFLEATDTKDKTINTWVEVEKFLQGITDTESLTALLKELEDNVTVAYTQAIAEALEDSGNLVHIEYAELVTLRDSGQLAPGKLYRITDYITTVANDPEARSAEHPFDLVVLALSADTLSEEAMAMQSDRDTEGYFLGCTPEAWKVWYCLDNDTRRFQWADPENGRGVIYRLIDECGNDCPYDFKNIQFKRYYTSGNFVDNVMSSMPSPTPHYILCSGSNNFPNSMHVEDSEVFAWFYTFNHILDPDGVDTTDASLNRPIYSIYDGTVSIIHCRSNIMAAYYAGQSIDGCQAIIQALNNIVLAAYGECGSELVEFSENNWEVGCFNMTFHQRCNRNKFGSGCYNVVGFAFYENNLGRSCYDLLFGYSCFFNTFGNGCNSNMFGNDCSGNTFGNDCWDNIFANYCSNNDLENGCVRNIFYDYCDGNLLGHGNCDTTLGLNCVRNTFGFGCYANKLERECLHNTFGKFCYNNIFENRLQFITSEDHVHYTKVIGVDNVNDMQGAKILSGTGGTYRNLLEISFTANAKQTQFAGLNSAGELRIWAPADIVP